jgi:hypothetical protein
MTKYARALDIYVTCVAVLGPWNLAFARIANVPGGSGKRQEGSLARVPLGPLRTLGKRYESSLIYSHVFTVPGAFSISFFTNSQYKIKKRKRN